MSSNASSPSSVGSLDALDVLDEDVNRSKDSRATGYLGKSSEVSWMRTLDAEANDPYRSEKEIENSSKFPHKRTAPTVSMNYHIEPPEYQITDLFSDLRLDYQIRNLLYECQSGSPLTHFIPWTSSQFDLSAAPSLFSSVRNVCFSAPIILPLDFVSLFFLFPLLFPFLII
jgi:hypothetical protein